MKIYFVRKIEDKLQLLSRNFDVGDTVYWYRPREDEPIIVGSFLNNKLGSWFPKGVEKQLGSLKGIHSYTWGKIIGDISPEASWVKDGDEFDEDDWLLYGHHKDGFIIERLNKNCLKEDWCIVNYCKIKGSCGHFH